jgi:hypothetical protein
MRTAEVLRAAAVATCLGASCNVVGAKAWNLAHLHGENGRHLRSAAVLGDFEFAMRRGLSGINVGSGDLSSAPAKDIEDPLGLCFKTLNELAEFDGTDPREAGHQVEWFSRLAVEDPARLSRERAVLELGQAGERLRISELFPEPETGAGPEQVGAAIERLLDTIEPASAGVFAEQDRAHISAACSAALELPLDLAGARRLLRTATVLLERGIGPSEALIPIIQLSLELQRRCVGQALRRALRDEDPLVRAAANQASVTACGDSSLAALLSELNPREDPLVLSALLRLVTIRGFPAPPQGLDDEERASLRKSWLAILWALSNHPDGTVRIGAMRALSRVSGSGLTSLREEDWQTWWTEQENGSQNGPSQ